MMKITWLWFPKRATTKGKGLNELTKVEFIKHFLLGGREMEWLITQPSESIPCFKIKKSNWNKSELCPNDGTTGVSGGVLIQTDRLLKEEGKD